MVWFHIETVNCLSPSVAEPYNGDDAQNDTPTRPASCAACPAGAPLSKSHGVTRTSAPPSITSIAALPTVAGSVLPSTTFISSGRPSTPPAALICSTASCAPSNGGWSYAAIQPVRLIGAPMMIGSSSWATTWPLATIGANMSANAAKSIESRLRRIEPPCTGQHHVSGSVAPLFYAKWGIVSMSTRFTGIVCAFHRMQGAST